MFPFSSFSEGMHHLHSSEVQIVTRGGIIFLSQCSFPSSVIGFSSVLFSCIWRERVTLNISCLVVLTSNSACSCSACEMTWNLQRNKIKKRKIPAKSCNSQPLHWEVGLKIHGSWKYTPSCNHFRCHGN